MRRCAVASLAMGGGGRRIRSAVAEDDELDRGLRRNTLGRKKRHVSDWMRIGRTDRK